MTNSPEILLDHIVEAAANGNAAVMRGHAESLARWMESGGHPPKHPKKRSGNMRDAKDKHELQTMVHHINNASHIISLARREGVPIPDVEELVEGLADCRVKLVDAINSGF